MIALGCDVGASAGLALARDGVPIWAMTVKGCDTPDGRARLRLALEVDVRRFMFGFARPDRIVIERPTRNPKSKIDAYAALCERAGEMVALCEVVFPGVPILRPFPLDRNGSKGWQSIKAGTVGESKDRSVQVVVRSGAARDVLGACRSHDAADACCIAIWGSRA